MNEWMILDIHKYIYNDEVDLSDFFCGKFFFRKTVSFVLSYLSLKLPFFPSGSLTPILCLLHEVIFKSSTLRMKGKAIILTSDIGCRQGRFCEHRRHGDEESQKGKDSPPRLLINMIMEFYRGLCDVSCSLWAVGHFIRPAHACDIPVLRASMSGLGDQAIRHTQARAWTGRRPDLMRPAKNELQVFMKQIRIS